GLPDGLSGYELAKIAAQRQQDLKVLYTTGYAGAHKRDGGDDEDEQMLRKPYRGEQLAGQNTRILHGTKTDLLPLRRKDGATAPQLAGEGWLCRQDESAFFAEWNFTPWTGGGPPRLVGAYQDQTKLKSLREVLLQSQKLDTIGLLAGGVAHDFNNLLSVINGYCEIMGPKLAATPAAQKDLQEIQRAGLKASAIARQILEFSRRRETEIKVVNFNTLIREIVEILRRIAGEEITVELRLASNLGNTRIDPTQFQQVLLNFCFNARDAMVAGGKLTIRTRNHHVQSDADRPVAGMPLGRYTVMSISDTGHGMAPEVVGNIFAPYFTTKDHGTGLGLATVLGIIRQADGHIAVQSTPGQGSTFEIFLPETPELEQTPVTKLGALPGTRGSEKILLVEADEVLRKMIAGILATDGYTVVDAATPKAAQALVELDPRQPQLVLLPATGKSGLALVRHLATANSRLRLISTAAEPPATTLPGFPPKSMIHLPKPFALSTLLRNIRTLLDG
ncbi:MAG: ATP-binding protein, partial [Opitutae bacterium]